MAETYKILLFMKRRSGMTVEEFRDYYESVHAPLATKHARNLTRYVRRYIEPLPHPETGQWEDPTFDVITEIWVENEAEFRTLVQAMTTFTMPRNIIEDEDQLFDRSSFRIATVVERDTDMTDR